MDRILVSAALLFLASSFVFGQSESGIFRDIYPIGDQMNIGYKSSMVPKKEKLIFEANPIVRLPIFNNILDNLEDGKNGSALYFNFNPTIRMYDDNSKPVKTPSYKISLGFQRIMKLGNKDNNFLAFDIQSGHYSNGQAKCIYNKDIDDGSAECDQLAAAITSQTNLSEIINRESGNFSTNFSEVTLNYRYIIFDEEEYTPKSSLSVLFKYNRFHNNLLLLIKNLGGYSESDILIYGKNRFTLGASYMSRFSNESKLRKLKIDRWLVSCSYEFISKPHESVNPSRLELFGTLYFTNSMGIFIGGIFGHDNYNYRFVDSGSQVFTGLTYDIFPPVKMKK